MATKADVEFLIQAGNPEDLLPEVDHEGIAPDEAGPVRGLAIKSLTLNENYDGRISAWFGGQNEIYFIASSFMFGDEKPFLWPTSVEDAEKAAMKLKKDDTFRFDDLGSGAPLFPERELKSGICIGIHVMESDEDRVKAGEKMKAAADAVKSDGDIVKLLKSAITNPGGVGVQVALGAAAEVAKVIAAVLEKDGDESVGMFSTYFAMRESWEGKLKASRPGCSIELHEVKG